MDTDDSVIVVVETRKFFGLGLSLNVSVSQPAIVAMELGK